MLGRELAEAGRGLIVPEPVMDGEGAVISSSRIRDALAEGDVALAGALLGHDWQVRGEIVHGDKRGRLLGFPTANMLLRPDNRLRHGIYAVRMRLDGVWRPAVASFGRRPTFDDGAPRLETFVFDFAGDLYGRVVDVAFAGWIRPEMKFDGVDALIAQMQKDAALARAMTA
jgi:riboflavin kinase/FMN adenylyltransferase